MKCHSFFRGLNRLPFVFPALLVLVTGVTPHRATADVSANVSVWHGYDFFYPNLALNASGPAPVTFHWMESSSGSLWQQFGSTNGGNNFFLTNDLNAVIHECTNGLWKLYLNRGDAAEELYYFKMSITGVTTNVLGTVTIFSPPSGSTGVTNRPTFHWVGPSNLANINVQVSHEVSGNSYYEQLPSTATNWTPAGTLTSGENSLFVNYSSNNFPGITFTTPTNSSGVPLANWSAQGGLHTYLFSTFTVSAPPGGGAGGAALFGHYRFDNPSNLRLDSSGLGNDATSTLYVSGGTQFPQYDPTGVAGGAVEFDGYNALFWENGLTNLLRGSYSISLWLQTTETYGEDDDSPFVGASIVDAGSSIPMVQTGSKLAFHTANGNHTLYSANSINSGDFEHLVVTRDAITGEKRIYVNGVPDTSGTGPTGNLPTPTQVRLGHSFSGGLDIEGLVDDLQVYTNVLTADQVQFLFANPGTAAPTGGNDDLANAVDAPQLTWTSGGDGNWFRQTTETYDGMDAAQSGAIGHDENSWIQTTVEGPGTVSFWWNVSSDDFDGYDYLELAVDGNPESEIAGDWGWDYYEVNLGPGLHTLRWTYYKDGDYSAGDDAAWLDQVAFVPEIEVSMQLVIERSTDPENLGFFAYPTMDSVSPDPITAHEIESPNAMFMYHKDALNTYSSHPTLPTLQAVMDELEGGDWRIYINRGHPSERQYNFTVTVNTLALANLPAVNVTSPTEGQTGIATNHTFTWTGPLNYDSLFLNSFLTASGGASGGFTNPAPNLTSSKMPHALLPGNNAVYLNYTLNDYAGVEISEPLSGTTPLASWSGRVTLISSHTRRFAVANSNPPATPVQILNPLPTGTNFSLSFLTQAGRTHTVQTRTNLSTAPWVDLTNFVGDGSAIQLFLPLGTGSESYFRIGTQ